MFEWLSLLRDFAALLASIAVLYGVNAWRRDFVGKRQIELAEEVLSLFYRAKDAIAHMRSPAAYSFEIEHIIASEGESAEKTQARRSVAPLYKRYDEYSELFSEIQAARYRFIARFGDDNGKPFDDLQAVLREIFVAAKMLVTIAGSQTGPEYVNKRISYEQKIWWDGNEDVIASRVENIAKDIDDICREKIVPRSLVALALQKYKKWIRSTSWYRRFHRWLTSI